MHVGAFIRAYCKSSKRESKGCNTEGCNNYLQPWPYLFCGGCGNMVETIVPENSNEEVPDVNYYVVEKEVENYIDCTHGQYSEDKKMFCHIWLPVYRDRYNGIKLHNREFDSEVIPIYFRYTDATVIEIEIEDFIRAYAKEIEIIKKHYVEFSIDWGVLEGGYP